MIRFCDPLLTGAPQPLRLVVRPVPWGHGYHELCHSSRGVVSGLAFATAAGELEP
jgi:hypothetical protein